MMKIGAHGASRIAPVTGLASVCRTVSKSRSAWLFSWPPSDIIRVTICGDSAASSLALARISSRLLIASSAASVISATINAKCHEQQGRPAAGRDDAVVDLEHVERRRQEQQVEEEAERQRRDQVRPARPKRLCDRRRQL